VVITLITIWAFLFNIFGYELAWAVSPSGGFALPRSGANTGATPGHFILPSHLGEVKEVYHGSNPNTIIHIQDAHCNYSAQKNIKSIIEYLNTNYKVNLIGLEGGEGDYDLSVFTRIKDLNLRNKVANYFLKEGRINGAEYFAILNPDKVTLKGVENSKLYIKNLNIYKEHLKHKPKIDQALNTLENHITKQKQKIYSKKLLELDKKSNQYHNQELELKEYLTYLSDCRGKKSFAPTVETQNFVSLQTLTQIIEQEKEIDFASCETERTNLINTLKNHLAKVELHNLLKWTIDFKNGLVKEDFFYLYILEKTRSCHIDVDTLYPNLVKFARFLRKYEELDKYALFKELNEFEEHIFNELSDNDEQRQLYKLSKDFTILDKFFNIQLTRDEYEYYKNGDTLLLKQGVPIFATLTKYQKSLEPFYELSLKRDEAFIKNLSTIHDPPSTILITGGFHTDNLKQLFKKHGYSYVVILPKFDPTEKTPYFKLLSGKLSPLEEEMKAQRSSMAIASSFNLGEPIDPALINNLKNNSTELIRSTRSSSMEEPFDKEIRRIFSSYKRVVEAEKKGLLDKLIPRWTELKTMEQWGGHTDTVGEHTIGVLEASHREGYVARFKDPQEFLMALYFHDFGKNPKFKYQPDRHEVEGGQIVEAILKERGFTPIEAERTAWRVKHHSTIYNLTTTGEIGSGIDDESISYFLERITPEDVDILTFLVLAEIAQTVRIDELNLQNRKRLLGTSRLLREIAEDGDPERRKQKKQQFIVSLSLRKKHPWPLNTWVGNSVSTDPAVTSSATSKPAPTGKTPGTAGRSSAAGKKHIPGSGNREGIVIPAILLALSLVAYLIIVEPFYGLLALAAAAIFSTIVRTDVVASPSKEERSDKTCIAFFILLFLPFILDFVITHGQGTRFVLKLLHEQFANLFPAAAIFTTYKAAHFSKEEKADEGPDKPTRSSVTREYEHPLGDDQYIEATSPNLMSILDRLISWYINNGYENSEILEVYRKALKHAELTHKGADFGKVYGGINQHTGLPPVLVNIERLYKRLNERINSTHDLIFYSRYLPREAMGLMFIITHGNELNQIGLDVDRALNRQALQLFEPHIDEILRQNPQYEKDRMKAAGHLAKELDKYPDIVKLLNDNRDLIIDLTTKMITLEYLEGTEEVKAFNWAVEKNLFDPEQINPATKTDRDKDFLSSNRQDNEILAQELRAAAVPDFGFWLNEGPDAIYDALNRRISTFFILLQALSYKQSNGREGISPSSIDAMISNERPSIGELLASASLLLEPVRARAETVKKHSARVIADFKKRPALLIELGQKGSNQRGSNLTSSELNYILDRIMPKIPTMYLNNLKEIETIKGYFISDNYSFVNKEQIRLLIDYVRGRLSFLTGDSGEDADAATSEADMPSGLGDIVVRGLVIEPTDTVRTVADKLNTTIVAQRCFGAIANAELNNEISFTGGPMGKAKERAHFRDKPKIAHILNGMLSHTSASETPQPQAIPPDESVGNSIISDNEREKVLDMGYALNYLRQTDIFDIDILEWIKNNSQIARVLYGFSDIELLDGGVDEENYHLTRNILLVLNSMLGTTYDIILLDNARAVFLSRENMRYEAMNGGMANYPDEDRYSKAEVDMVMVDAGLDYAIINDVVRENGFFYDCLMSRKTPDPSKLSNAIDTSERICQGERPRRSKPNKISDIAFPSFRNAESLEHSVRSHLEAMQIFGHEYPAVWVFDDATEKRAEEKQDMLRRLAAEFNAGIRYVGQDEKNRFIQLLSEQPGVKAQGLTIEKIRDYYFVNGLFASNRNYPQAYFYGGIYSTVDDDSTSYVSRNGNLTRSPLMRNYDARLHKLLGPFVQKASEWLVGAEVLESASKTYKDLTDTIIENLYLEGGGVDLFPTVNMHQFISWIHHNVKMNPANMSEFWNRAAGIYQQLILDEEFEKGDDPLKITNKPKYYPIAELKKSCPAYRLPVNAYGVHDRAIASQASTLKALRTHSFSDYFMEAPTDGIVGFVTSYPNLYGAGSISLYLKYLSEYGDPKVLQGCVPYRPEKAFPWNTVHDKFILSTPTMTTIYNRLNDDDNLPGGLLVPGMIDSDQLGMTVQRGDGRFKLFDGGVVLDHERQFSETRYGTEEQALDYSALIRHFLDEIVLSYAMRVYFEGLDYEEALVAIVHDCYGTVEALREKLPKEARPAAARVIRAIHSELGFEFPTMDKFKILEKMRVMKQEQRAKSDRKKGKKRNKKRNKKEQKSLLTRKKVSKEEIKEAEPLPETIYVHGTKVSPGYRRTREGIESFNLVRGQLRDRAKRQKIEAMLQEYLEKIKIREKRAPVILEAAKRLREEGQLPFRSMSGDPGDSGAKPQADQGDIPSSRTKISSSSPSEAPQQLQAIPPDVLAEIETMLKTRTEEYYKLIDQGLALTPPGGIYEVSENNNVEIWQKFRQIFLDIACFGSEKGIPVFEKLRTLIENNNYSNIVVVETLFMPFLQSGSYFMIGSHPTAINGRTVIVPSPMLFKIDDRHTVKRTILGTPVEAVAIAVGNKIVADYAETQIGGTSWAAKTVPPNFTLDGLRIIIYRPDFFRWLVNEMYKLCLSLETNRRLPDHLTRVRVDVERALEALLRKQWPAEELKDRDQFIEKNYLRYLRAVFLHELTHLFLNDVESDRGPYLMEHIDGELIWVRLFECVHKTFFKIASISEPNLEAMQYMVYDVLPGVFRDSEPGSIPGVKADDHVAIRLDTSSKNIAVQLLQALALLDKNRAFAKRFRDLLKARCLKAFAEIAGRVQTQAASTEEGTDLASVTQKALEERLGAGSSVLERLQGYIDRYNVKIVRESTGARGADLEVELDEGVNNAATGIKSATIKCSFDLGRSRDLYNSLVCKILELGKIEEAINRTRKHKENLFVSDMQRLASSGYWAHLALFEAGQKAGEYKLNDEERFVNAFMFFSGGKRLLGKRSKLRQAITDRIHNTKLAGEFEVNLETFQKIFREDTKIGQVLNKPTQTLESFPPAERLLFITAMSKFLANRRLVEKKRRRRSSPTQPADESAARTSAARSVPEFIEGDVIIYEDGPIERITGKETRKNRETPRDEEILICDYYERDGIFPAKRRGIIIRNPYEVIKKYMLTAEVRIISGDIVKSNYDMIKHAAERKLVDQEATMANGTIPGYALVGEDGVIIKFLTKEKKDATSDPTIELHFTVDSDEDIDWGDFLQGDVFTGINDKGLECSMTMARKALSTRISRDNIRYAVHWYNHYRKTGKDEDLVTFLARTSAAKGQSEGAKQPAEDDAPARASAARRTSSSSQPAAGRNYAGEDAAEKPVSQNLADTDKVDTEIRSAAVKALTECLVLEDPERVKSLQLQFPSDFVQQFLRAVEHIDRWVGDIPHRLMGQAAPEENPYSYLAEHPYRYLAAASYILSSLILTSNNPQRLYEEFFTTLKAQAQMAGIDSIIKGIETDERYIFFCNSFASLTGLIEILEYIKKQSPPYGQEVRLLYYPDPSVWKRSYCKEEFVVAVKENRIKMYIYQGKASSQDKVINLELNEAKAETLLKQIGYIRGGGIVGIVGGKRSKADPDILPWLAYEGHSHPKNADPSIPDYIGNASIRKFYLSFDWPIPSNASGFSLMNEQGDGVNLEPRPVPRLSPGVSLAKNDAPARALTAELLQIAPKVSRQIESRLGMPENHKSTDQLYKRATDVISHLSWYRSLRSPECDRRVEQALENDRDDLIIDLGVVIKQLTGYYVEDEKLYIKRVQNLFKDALEVARGNMTEKEFENKYPIPESLGLYPPKPYIWHRIEDLQDQSTLDKA